MKFLRTFFKRKTFSLSLKKEQKELLDKMFELWRGELEQIDDVCVIGVGIQ